MVRLALIERNTDLRAALTGMLARAGYPPEVFESAEDFLGSDSVSTFELVVSEFPMEGQRGGGGPEGPVTDRAGSSRGPAW